MRFSKYVGSGNDFILIDNRNLSFPSDNKLWISKLCHRQFGIGADGLILLENSKTADFKMRIFNSDGSEAEMCGNGIRCFYQFLQEVTEISDSQTVETKAGHIYLEKSLDGDHSDVKVSMLPPSDIKWNLKVKIDSEEITLHSLNTGVPHVVIFSESINNLDLKKLGSTIRHHPLFQPKGTNVNFVEILTNNEISIRTYERGVEDETLACGTGATAAAIAACYQKDLDLPLKVKTRSGENLTIDCTIEKPIIKNVTMTGPALFVFRGEVLPASTI